MRASICTSLCAPAESEPAQNVSPLCGLSTALRNHSMSLSQVTMRGSPRIGYGGSSGCTHILIPHSSQTGMIALRKYFMFSLSLSVSMSLYKASKRRNSSTGCFSPSLKLPLTNPCVLITIFSISCCSCSWVMVCLKVSTSASISLSTPSILNLRQSSTAPSLLSM